MAVDFGLILIAYYAAFTLRHDVMGGTVTVDVRSDGYIYLSIVYAAMMVLCFYLMHLYELPQVMRGKRESCKDYAFRCAGHRPAVSRTLFRQAHACIPVGTCDGLAV